MLFGLEDLVQYNSDEKSHGFIKVLLGNQFCTKNLKQRTDIHVLGVNQTACSLMLSTLLDAIFVQ